MSDHGSSSTTTQIAQNSVFERFARAGYVVSGLLHLTIGYLASRSALRLSMDSASHGPADEHCDIMSRHGHVCWAKSRPQVR